MSELRRVVRPARIAVAAGALLLLGGCGEQRREVGSPEAAVLRAADMPRGYREGDDTACGLASTEDEDSPLAALFGSGRPRACIIELERVWAPYRVVTSAAYVFRSADAAERAFSDRGPLLEYTASLSTRVERTTQLGDEAAVVQGRGLNDPAVATVWRSGKVVAVLAVEPADSGLAAAFARRQQRRIAGEAPASLTVDTVELELDDPSLALPVYWLGRSFDPAGSLPALQLSQAVTLGTGPGDDVKMDYAGVAGGRVVGVTLDLWRPRTWARFRRTLLGRLVWDSACAKKTVVRLPNGRAEIFAGYGTRRPLRPPCPDRPPDRVVAQVYLPGVVVAVDMPYCYGCAAPPATRNPFETVAGMTEIARGLRLRR